MALLLGIDTGGTYTDAVIVDDSRTGADAAVAIAKSLTTPIDLSVGIGRAIDEVLIGAKCAPNEIALVSVSTTLATNALVERRGGTIALVFIGFDADATHRAGLIEALDGDPVIELAGGHDSQGRPQADLDLDALRTELESLPSDVVGFAVAAQFGVRNPEHELAARDVIRSVTQRPVTCSHELSGKLDGPRRALTSVLNARLIGMIDALLTATERLLAQRSIDAPLVVVRGDGSLVAVDLARDRPIETVLSGPAASIVGAQALCDEPNALVADIGGTTTDIAVLVDGQPQLTPEGATVGGLRTMVEAVDMRTIGLGGDSEVAVDDTSADPALRLGPRRIVPTSTLALDHPDLVHDTLDRQLGTYRHRELFGQFAIVQIGADHALTLADREARVLEALLDGPIALEALIGDRRDLLAFERLVRRGYAQRSGFTPTDACHVLELHDGFDIEAATKAAQLFASRRDRFDQVVAPDAPAVSNMVIEQLVAASASALLEAALVQDGFDPALANSALANAALDHHRGAVATSLAVALPVIALGASAPTYYGAVGERLQAETQWPDLASVANAFGAVVGHVRAVVTASVSQLDDGPWRLFGLDTPLDFVADDDAILDGEELARRAAIKQAHDAGASDVEVTVVVDRRTATIEDTDVLVEAIITATAVGRPQLGQTAQ